MKASKLIISSFILFSLLAPFSHASEKGIEVTGTAKQSVVPDMVMFSFSINDRGKDLSSLKADIDKKAANTVSLCKKLGIKTRDITSAKLSIRPQYNYQTKSFIGYDVSRTIKVVLKDLDKYSDLVNGVIKAGITNVNYVALDTSDRKELQRKTLGAAITDARKKADIIAKSSGVEIGKVLYMKEGVSPIRLETYAFKERAVSADAQGAFEPGEISLTATVTVRYAIK